MRQPWVRTGGILSLGLGFTFGFPMMFVGVDLQADQGLSAHSPWATC